MKKSLIVGAICALLASVVVGYADQEAQQTLKLHTAAQPYTGDDYIKMERGGAMWKIPANTLGSGGGGGSTLPGGSPGQIQTNVGGATFGGSNLTTLIDLAFGSTQGDILYRDSSSWSVLLPGASGQFLKTQGAAANPAWATVTGGSGCATTGAANNIVTDNGTGGCASSAYGLLSNTALTLGLNGGQGGKVVLNGSTSGSSTLQVPAAAGTSTLFQLPNTNGSSNQVLITDGSGHTSWVNAGAGSVTAPTSLATHYPVIGGANGTTDVKTIASPLTNGQTLCGSTGADPVACTPTGTNGAVLSGGAGTINVSVIGAAVDNGAVTPATVTTTGTTAVTTRREKIGTLGASIIRTLPLISTGGVYTTGLAPDSMVCYDDLGANVTPTNTLTILPNAADGINGGSVGVGVGPWTSLTENCFRVAGLHNWAQADGVPTSNAPAGSVATSLGINGLGYDPLSTVMDSALGSTQGSVIYRGATAWNVLGPGTAGQVLQTGGAAANPSWTTSASNIPVNPQTGTTYTVVTGDQGKLVTLSNGASIAVTLPQAGTAGFAAAWGTRVTNIGAGTATITPTTSTFNGASTIVLTTGMSALIVSDGTNYEGAVSVPTSSGGGGGGTIVQGQIGGLTTSKSSNTVLAVAAGTATDNAVSEYISIGAFTKSTAGAFATGTGSNGMGNALTIANNTYYHVMLIDCSTGGAHGDIYFDTSISAANIPACATKFRRIGSFKTNGSAQILAFIQRGDEFTWGFQSLDVNAATITGATQTNETLGGVPPGVVTTAHVTLFNNTASLATVNVFDPSTAQDLTGGNAMCAINSASTTGHVCAVDATTNTSQQIAVLSDTTITSQFYINTRGYRDFRGQ